MKKKFMKAVSIIMILAIVVACIVMPANAKEIKKVKVTVLGDSVAYGSYVTAEERFGDVLADKLEKDGYDVDYTNYAVPKYSSKSVWYDLNEETYAYDNNRFVAELGAPDLREGISYNQFIDTLEKSDIIILHAGENDLAASFYKMRGYDDYYIFYGNERNIPLVQNDISNRKIQWIYTLNNKKIEACKKEFVDIISEYIDKDVAKLKQINPNAQIILCDMFNPYQDASDGLDYTFYLINNIIVNIKELPTVKTFEELTEKVTAISTDYATLTALLAVMVPGLIGKDIDHCGGFDISNLYTFEKILYKIQYLRVEKGSVEMYKDSVSVYDTIGANNNVAVSKITQTLVHKNMASDGVHPNGEGHKIIAQKIYDTIDFSKICDY